MPILTVTLNPAVDIATDFDTLVANKKMRCGEPAIDPGGGGVNVSRAIAILGGESRTFVAVAGAIGEQLVKLLQRESLEPVTFQVEGETRQSFSATAVDTNEQYRFVLPGPQWRPGACQSMEEKALENSEEDDLVVLSGSLPPGLPSSCYASLTRALARAGRRVVVDTSGEALAAFLDCATDRDETCHPYCLRMNRPEAESLAGKELPGRDQLVDFGKSLVKRGIAEVVTISNGAEGSYFFNDLEQHFVPAPDVKRTSAIGAGDSFVAALTLGFLQGWSLQRTACYAVAAASSALSTPASDLCDRETAEKIFEDLLGKVG